MSEAVERRLLELLDHPTESPYGNPIPGLAELGETGPVEDFRAGVVSLDLVETGPVAAWVRVRRISEPVQTLEATMAALRRVGALPGSIISVSKSPYGLRLGSAGETAELDHETAGHIFVSMV